MANCHEGCRDARIINSSTGRYVERLLTYLQQIDTINRYTVLVPTKDVTFWWPTVANFQVMAADFANFSLAEHPDLGLILVGKINKAIAKNQAYFEKQGYKNIHFTGFVSDEERDWLFTHASAYVFPSPMEGFGLPGLEAMSYGAPVVSSNATCLPEVYEHAAHYFDPTSSDDMARAINDVLLSDELRAQLIASGYAQVKKYSWLRMAKQTHAIYLAAFSPRS